ncbi:DUF695 domain-containing protein [Solitalea sp. MAHUQ-68]|uniref:DUF695 domain-containing protein n=1 Tax=Solitalea agri TaxID=2953739 RepID=A0A9X2F7W4_9SPHI|nr:DUF695 domain-containing protein [Solitalea agri]MCO4292258.1 DUF695 domain-containing protein [Solitalea agri]
MIGLDKIEELFNNMKSNGVNTDSEMLYGYFFTNQTSDQLEKLADQLKGENYKFVDIHQDEDKLFWLHVERVEKHNPKSLFALNEELYKQAEKYKLDSYDGFDIGNTDPNKPIDRDTYAVPEEFKTADFDQDGHPFLLIGNAAFEQFPHKEEFCHFIKITTQYKAEENSLLPSEKELDEMNDFEFFIENNLTKNGVRNYYVFRDTHKGLRHFYLVTNDKDEAPNILEFLKTSGDQRKFDFEILTDKNWTLYNDILGKLKDAE